MISNSRSDHLIDRHSSPDIVPRSFVWMGSSEEASCRSGVISRTISECSGISMVQSRDHEYVISYRCERFEER